MKNYHFLFLTDTRFRYIAIKMKKIITKELYNMKKIIYLWCALALIAFAGCSSDKNEWGDDSQEADLMNEEMFLAQANLTPEFQDRSLSNVIRSHTTTETDQSNLAEIRRDGYGCIRYVSFRNTPIKDRPSTPEEFVSLYLGVDFSENFQLAQEPKLRQGFDGTFNHPYIQFYKGIEVEGNLLIFHYSEEKRVFYVNGIYLPVNDLDVTPAFSENTARKIFAKYLDLPVEDIWEDVSLYIVEFPLSAESEQWAPRLVYKLGVNFNSDEGQCYIDAKTGRILYTFANYGIKY